MDMSLFTSFDGRINRAKWWLGAIVLVVISVILNFILMMFLGGSMFGGMDAANVSAETINSMYRKIAIAQIVAVAIIAYPATALMKKRINDRDRPAWLVYVFWAPTVVSLLLSLTGLGYTVMDAGGVSMPGPSGLSWVVNLAGLAIGIWALIELGILKGTEGSNQHGPDPLAG